MSDYKPNAMRDALINSMPSHESAIRSRDEVVNSWCAEHGISRDEITIVELLKIRALPEWQNAS